MYFYILAVLIGLTSPLQTAVNSRLRASVGDAIVAAFISFVISVILLAALFFATGEYLLPTASDALSAPWWAWLGGVFGMIFVATIIPLFKAIGSVQSIVLPIFGQIVSSLIIDNYGWLGMPHHAVTPIRLFGVLLVFVGVILVVVVPNIKSLRAESSKTTFLWQLYGIVLGVVMTMNAVTNGKLGIELNSSLAASTISSTIGAILLMLLCILRRNIGQAKLLFNKHNPWWIGLGGVFGAMLVGGNTFIIPIIGVGALAVLALFGQMSISVCIDKFGLFAAEKKHVGWIQLSGIAVMFVGVVLINLMQM
jgi:transporter family-2 protein